MTRSLVIKFFTTAALGADDRLVEFARATKRLYGAAALSGEIAAQADDSPLGFADVETLLESGLPKWKGCLTVAFGDGDSLSGRMDLLCVKKKRSSSVNLGELAAYRTHEFTIEIGPKHRGNRNLLKRLFPYFCQSAVLLRAEFGLCQENDGFLGSLPQAKGLEAGLPGIFRMNAFGPAFTALIGAEKLLNLPAFLSQELPGGTVAVQVDHELHRDSTTEMQAQRISLRDQIGKEFFVSTKPVKLAMESGQIGLWTLLSALRKSKQVYNSSERLAARTPALDWSGVFEC